MRTTPKKQTPKLRKMTFKQMRKIIGPRIPKPIPKTFSARNSAPIVSSGRNTPRNRTVANAEEEAGRA
jgi:hypothetical protein